MTDSKVTTIELQCKQLALHTIDGEPVVRDVDLAERLGMARPTNIRGVVEKNRTELEGYGPLHTASAMVEIGSGAKRETIEYRLNEPQALLVCIKSSAPRAPEARREVIEVFMAWRRGLLSHVQPDAVSVRIGDLKQMIREAVEAERLASPQNVAIGYVSALDVAIRQKVPQKGRRGIVLLISARLRKFCAQNGYPVRLSAESGKYLFPQEAVDDWLLQDGFLVIRRHLSKLEGQGVFHLVNGGRKPA